MTNHQFELEQFIPCQLSELSTTINRAVSELFEERYQLSITEWKVLVTVARHPGLSAVAVAECAGLDTVAVSRAVSKLMDADRIERSFGREDRRRSILSLSEEGRRLYEEVLPIATRLQKSLLDGLSEEERAVFAKVIGKLDKRSSDFVFDVRRECGQEPAVERAPAKPVRLRTNTLSLTRTGLGMMPRRRAV